MFGKEGAFTMKTFDFSRAKREFFDVKIAGAYETSDIAANPLTVFPINSRLDNNFIVCLDILNIDK